MFQQPLPQKFAPARQATRKCSLGNAERLRGIGAGRPLEFAQHERLAVLRRQRVQFSIENGKPVRKFGGRVRVGDHFESLGSPIRCSRGSRCTGAGFHRHPEGDAVEPRADPIAAPDRANLLDQHEERCLERILGIGRVRQHSPADAEDHWAVPTKQHLERGVFAVAGEAVEQIGVGQFVECAGAESVAEPACGRLVGGNSGTGHGASLRVEMIVPTTAAARPRFCRIGRRNSEGAGDFEVGCRNHSRSPKYYPAAETPVPTIKQLAPFSQYDEATAKGLLGKDDKNACLACSLEWIRLCLCQYQSLQESQSQDRMKLLSSMFRTIAANQNTYVQYSNANKVPPNKMHYHDRVANTINILGGSPEDKTSLIQSIASTIGDDRCSVQKTANHPRATDAEWKQFVSPLFAVRAAHILGLKVVDPSDKSKKGYHAVATYGAGKFIYLFDPHKGEYQIDGADFSRAVDLIMWPFTQGKYSVHTLRKYAVAVGNPSSGAVQVPAQD